MNKRFVSTRRDGKDRDRFELLLKSVVGRRLTYEQLIGALGAGTV